jgi:hypothetical protein
MAFEEHDKKASPTETEVMAAQALSRRDVIARVAYQLAAKRGFAPGHELDDWLAAERQREAWERGCGRDPNWP